MGWLLFPWWGWGGEEPGGAAPPPSGVVRDRVEARWMENGSALYYRADWPDGRREFVHVSSATGARRALIDHNQLASALSHALGEVVTGDRLPLDQAEWDEATHEWVFHGTRGKWAWDVQGARLRRVEEASPAIGEGPTADRTRSPDGKWEVRVRGHNLVLHERATGAERPLTYDGHPTSSYQRNGALERSVGMEFDRLDDSSPTPEIHWAPDSLHFVAMRFEAGTDRRVYLIDAAPADQLQPKLSSYPYLKPGDQVPVQWPRLFEVPRAKEVVLSTALFPNPWSISEVRWDESGRQFTMLYNERGHQLLRVLRVLAETGEISVLVEERSPTFVCYSGKYFCEFLDRTSELIWMSERDGWNHLYLYDTTTGLVKRQLTSGRWVVRGVEKVDAARRELWFFAGGIHPDDDPYYRQLCRLSLDAPGVTILTEPGATHSIQLAPNLEWFLDTWSRVDLPPVTELRSAREGARIATLEQADISTLDAEGWRAPSRFIAKGRDGATDIHGIYQLPSGEHAPNSIAIIEEIYAGPHSAFVPKAFRARYRWEELVKAGFAVVQIDGMGTSHRSKAFHDVAWKNLGDSGFLDRIAWIQALAAQHPELDSKRVGLYGGSAGGQSALRGLLMHGDFYKAGASDCGCHDNRMDKIWWNEQWMGWPPAAHYVEQSNVTQAHRLTGALLLTVGAMDRNVDPSSTYQVIEALIKADKDFEMIVFPSGGHGAGESPYGRRRRLEFFRKHLR